MPTPIKSNSTKPRTTKRPCKLPNAEPKASCADSPQPEAESKKSRFLALLQRAEGATLSELMAATGWQAHSVRGFISGVLRKKQGLKVALIASPNGGRVYRAGV